jgi:pimeloyl-ACP methyl ester carboxylesterase
MTTATRTWAGDTVRVGDLAIELLKGGSGDPLLVLHDDIGNPGWLPLYDELSSARTVYVPSHAGFGKSERADWARDIRDMAMLEGWLLRELGLGQVDGIGFGFGAWMLAEMAVMCPGRLRKMVLVNPTGVQPREGEIFDQFLLSQQQYARFSFANQANFSETFGEELDVDTLEQLELNREMTCRVAWSPYMFDQALPHLLPGCRVPALVVRGAEDAVVPEDCARQYVELLPDARLEVIGGGGHAVYIEKPAELARLTLDFLATK